MNRRSFQLLAALAAGLLLLLFFVERTGRDAPAAVGTMLLPDLAGRVADIEEIAIDSAADAGDLSIERREGAWVVTTRDDYPADFGTLRNLVDALATARIVEVATSDPQKHSRLGVDEPSAAGGGTRVSLRGNDLDLAVVIGNAAQGGYRYVRLGNEPQSYLVDTDPGLPVDTAGWLAREIVDIDSARIRRIEIVHADGETIVIERDGDEFAVANVPEGRELSYPSVGNGIARALEGLSLDDVRADADAPIGTTASFETEDGLVITARVATLDERDWIAFAASAETADGAAAEAEADSINGRVADWWYELPASKAELFVRRWEDLLAEDQDAGE
jgi:hypothetical protein